MSEKGKRGKKKTGLGLAVWILAVLIILIVFLVKQEEIKENFEKSGASALIEKKIGKDIFEGRKDGAGSGESGETVIDLKVSAEKKGEPENTGSEEAVRQEEAERMPSRPQKMTDDLKAPPEAGEKMTADIPEEPEKPKPGNEIPPSPGAQESRDSEQAYASGKTPSQSAPVAKALQETARSAPPPAASTVKATVCFVAIDSDGPVVRKTVTRSVRKDSPLYGAMSQLLAGPSASEAMTGCRTLIPDGTRLLGASINSGVASLNFSEEFQFNQFGAEGSLAQLMQVVYTATSFSTVKSVQILIDGQKRDYLTEGVWIGSPLSRSSF